MELLLRLLIQVYCVGHHAPIGARGVTWEPFSMSAHDNKYTTDEWQAEIGERLRAARIRQRLEQKELASAANISVSAIKNLEGGKGSSLRSLIGVLRALRLEEIFQALPPTNMVNPLEIARTGEMTLPQRVVKNRKKP